MELESIVGDLRAYKQLEPGTFQHSDQLTAERRTNHDLRDQYFYTADGEIYFMKDNNPMLAITRESHNPVLNNVDEAFTQLTQEGNYHINQEEAETAISAEDTEVFDLTKLNLFGGNSEYQYLTVSTSVKGYEELNSEERQLAERVYGQGDKFAEAMKMFADASIEETRIYVLNPEYVQKEATDSFIGRASWLYDFGDDSDFDANYRDIDIHNRLRGVRASEASTETPEGRTAPTFEQVIALAQSYVPPVCKDKFTTELQKLYK